jgi:PIN domain nuclease of toxin-antitoxin system
VAGYLIDSHIFFWGIDAPERLLAIERMLLEDPANDVAVSVASFWELSLKAANGKLRLSPGKAPVAGDYFARHAMTAGFRALAIEPPEAEYVRRLPRIHADPFDRLISAQALIGARMIVTRDGIFASYPGVQIFVP